MNRRKYRWPGGAIAWSLGIVTFAVFAPAAHHEFIGLDDPDYVSANGMVQQGFTWAGLRWAFQAGHAGNWHPVTWLSHMFDVQFFRLDAGRHHLVNVLFHSLNAGLLFLVLRRMTGALWRSVFVAALFALHPLHVESVAWVAERKDVLSGLFFILTLGAYARYVEARRSQIGQAGQWQWWYGVALALFALGLMSKPMLVTVPFVLLLLDVWPLQRLQLTRAGGQGAELRQALVEKTPFLLLSLLACLVTVVAQKRGQAVASFDLLPFPDRLENAVTAYVKYLGSTFWPTRLAVFYPHPSLGYAAACRWSGWQIAAGAGSLAAISVAAFLRLRREPWLAAGWCWYLGTLVPVIGIVQVGEQARADRYTYLPLIGIFIACSWLAADLARRSRFAHVAAAVAGVVIIGLCAVLARRQLGHWSNGIALFTHARAVTSHNPKVEFSLGQAWLKAGKADEAMVHLRASLADAPAAAETHYTMGKALAKLGRVEEAVDEFQNVLVLVPGHQNAADALVDLLMRRGAQAMRAGQTNDAEVIFAAALATRADLVERNIRAGLALAARGQCDDAISNLTCAVWLAPKNADARLHLGLVQARCARLGEAALQFRRVLDLNPDQPTAATQLAWILATAPANEIRDGNEALRLARQVNRNSEVKTPAPLLALAAALAETGRFEEALAATEQARELAERAGMSALAEQSRKLLACFQSKTPFRQSTVVVAGPNPP